MNNNNSMTVNDNNGNRKKGIAGSSLKLIAIITMLIDHIAAVMLERVITVLKAGTAKGWVTNLYNMDIETLEGIYYVMRGIGRIAFPIFCFLLVEGFMHTKNVWKYALRLAVFVFVSEIPFDLAFYDTPFYFNYQNVFFTLLIGLLTLIGLQYISEKLPANSFVTILANAVVIFAGIAVAVLLKTDYAGMGIMTIVAMYILKKNHTISMLGGCTVLALLNYFEIPAFIALIPAWLYNGKRGLNLKYIFYIFYPAHLLILYLICYFMQLV